MMFSFAYAHPPPERSETGWRLLNIMVPIKKCGIELYQPENFAAWRENFSVKTLTLLGKLDWAHDPIKIGSYQSGIPEDLEWDIKRGERLDWRHYDKNCQTLFQEMSEFFEAWAEQNQAITARAERQRANRVLLAYLAWFWDDMYIRMADHPDHLRDALLPLVTLIERHIPQSSPVYSVLMRRFRIYEPYY